MFRSTLLDIPEKEKCREAVDWYSKCFDYIVPYGKRFRARAVVHTFSTLTPDATLDDMIRAHAVGWSVELLQASFLIADDIEDKSVMRRGKPSWHTLPEVQLMAVNDLQQLHVSAYRLIDRFMKGHPAHLNILMLMTETGRQATLGQTMDLMTFPPTSDRVNFDLLKMDRLKTIAELKTSVYAFCHPVRHGLYLAGIDDHQLHMDVEEMLMPLGVFYQIQDDFIDVFEKSDVSGKKGTDIQDGKCTWLIIKALEKANDEQKEILKSNYGVHSDSSENRVKEVFESLKIREEYAAYEANEYSSLKKNIAAFSEKYPSVPSVIFDSYLESLFRRSR